MKEYNGKISIIMSAHNEGYHIYQNLKETQQVFEEAGCDYEIVLVNDGSSDDTSLEALKAANESTRIKIVEIKENHGKGYVVNATTSIFWTPISISTRISYTLSIQYNAAKKTNY